MFARRNRLASRRIFAQIRQRGVRRSGDFLVVRALSGGSRAPRIAVVMSTKAAKGAVVRNRHKRIIRDELRQLLATIPNGWNIVVTVRRSAHSGDEEQKIREEVRKLFGSPFSA